MRSDYHLSSAQVERVIYRGPARGCHAWRDRCLLKLLAQTGARRFEAAGLDVADLDLGARRIHIREGKGGRSRLIPISDDLASDLDQLISLRRRGPVFLSGRGRRLSIRQVSRIVSDAGARAGVRNPDPDSQGRLGCHLFRHTLARRWKDSGAPIESLSRILGHASVATTLDLYGTKSADDVQADFDAWHAVAAGDAKGRGLSTPRPANPLKRRSNARSAPI